MVYVRAWHLFYGNREIKNLILSQTYVQTMMGFLFIAALSLLDVSHLANTTSKIVLERTKAIYVVQYCNNIRIQTYSIRRYLQVKKQYLLYYNFTFSIVILDFGLGYILISTFNNLMGLAALLLIECQMDLVTF